MAEDVRLRASHDDTGTSDSYHITALLAAGYADPGISHGDDGQVTVTFYTSMKNGFYSGTADNFHNAVKAALANGAEFIPSDKQIEDAAEESVAL